ncbi:MAG: hypothetical protein LBQ88_18665, partial [Treponema sp.]|nr:hypothetical protein [Treponema sp.]
LVEERRDEKLPVVPLPSPKEMERRKVLANYAREQRNRTRHMNTLHSLFVHQGITRVVRSNLRFAGLFAIYCKFIPCKLPKEPR